MCTILANDVETRSAVDHGHIPINSFMLIRLRTVWLTSCGSGRQLRRHDTILVGGEGWERGRRKSSGVMERRGDA